MSKYHVLVDNDANIIAACFTKNGNWTNKTNVTKEALEAVRDHLLMMSAKQQMVLGYAWNYPDGKTLVLKIEERMEEENEDRSDTDRAGDGT